MGDIKVGYESLDVASGNIRSKALAIDEKLDAMERRMLGRADRWTGSASASFAEARLEWEGAMKDMKEILGDIGVAVSRSNAAYMAAEMRNARRFGGAG